MRVYTNTNYIHLLNGKHENWKEIDKDKIFLSNWLSDDGRFVMNQSFVGFGVGRRDCIGRQLAMKELQYILGFLLMKYKFRLNKEINNILDHRKKNYAVIYIEPSIGVKVEKL